jgi:hypothetical protein
LPIFSDDIASDVRDRYREHLGDGVPDTEATRLGLEESVEELADDETAPIVWLALATAQSRVGRLEDRVRAEAIRVIDAGTDLPRWREDPRAMAKRQAALAGCGMSSRRTVGHPRGSRLDRRGDTRARSDRAPPVRDRS